MEEWEFEGGMIEDSLLPHVLVPRLVPSLRGKASRTLVGAGYGGLHR